ncbi:hypothetical protein B0H15DRAFT_597092 [Mycena belliarum]|uniref:Uncharacterized protein n=1 Tax=Mycena belliarum TaxID=1033014 RepID=A0AAD6TSL2_9AGAR|nr:hypothetical protein B0H15DRAFT_597092 [Mycena belliae]
MRKAFCVNRLDQTSFLDGLLVLSAGGCAECTFIGDLLVTGGAKRESDSESELVGEHLVPPRDPRPNKMNTTKAAYIDNNFGPPSELVHVAQFIQSTSSALSLPQYPPDIAQQCSVSDIRDSLTSVGDDARLMAHMIKTHELLIASLHMAAEKRTRKRPVVREAPIDTPEILSLQSDLDNVSLESWKLQSNAAIFIRAVKSSDQNILTHSKSTRIDDGHLSAETPQAIISVAVYDRLPWRQTHVSLCSRHAILSSQTLGDLFEAIPCTSSEMTEEIVDDGNVTGYQEAPPRRPGAVICIEGLAYGDGENELDYAEYVHRSTRSSFQSPRHRPACTIPLLHPCPFASASHTGFYIKATANISLSSIRSGCSTQRTHYLDIR